MIKAQTKALLSNEALAEQVAGGDADAFAALAQRLGPKLAAFAAKVVLDAALGEDMVQDAFLKYWRQPDRYDPGKAKFSTWMHKVVFNRCLDAKRRKQPQPLEDGFDQADDAVLADTALIDGQRDAQIRGAIDALPERQRAALLLCHMEGVSNQDAADILEVKVKALESLLSRARANLKTALTPLKEDLL
ncbi:MAG: sigma-70 family RNA polymerase sigma factor [Pseudomonadota bacterium]